MKQRNPDDPLAIAIVATREAAASVVYGIYEVMTSVGRAWQLLPRIWKRDWFLLQRRLC